MKGGPLYLDLFDHKTLLAQSSGGALSYKLPSLEATFGLDHERLIFAHRGRPFRLSKVAGKVVQEILA